MKPKAMLPSYNLQKLPLKFLYFLTSIAIHPFWTAQRVTLLPFRPESLELPQLVITLQI